MSDSNKIIQGLWVNGSLNVLHRLCIQSYLANGHEFHLYTYNGEIEVPPGTVIKAANEIVPQKDIFFDNRGSLCSFADLFRYELLFECGGWWVDLDQICLKSFDFESDYVFASEYNPSFHQNVCIGSIKVPRHSDIMHYCRQMAYKAYRSNFPLVTWGVLGSRVLKSYLDSNKSFEDYILPPHVFCPMPYFHYNLLFNDFLSDFTEKSYGIHFWNEILRVNRVDLNMEFHKNSYFERLKVRYG